MSLEVMMVWNMKCSDNEMSLIFRRFQPNIRLNEIIIIQQLKLLITFLKVVDGNYSWHSVNTLALYRIIMTSLLLQIGHIFQIDYRGFWLID